MWFCSALGNAVWPKLLNENRGKALQHLPLMMADAKPPAFPAFLVYLKEKMLIHRAAAIANRTLENFKTRWTTLLSLLSD